MKTAKQAHTPGPIDRPSELYFKDEVSSEQIRECLRRWDCHTELLEACQMALFSFEKNEPHSHITTDLKNAIAKAEGKSLE